MGACELESGDVALAAIPIRKMTIGIAQTLPLIIDWRIAMPKRTTGDRPELRPVNVGAAAIDIGSKMHMAAVNPASTDVPVRSFGTVTQDLHDLADWFKARRDQRRDGIHRYLLDPRLRDPGAARV